MAEDPSGEKSFAPTEKRLKDASKNGDLLRSKDLGVAATMMIGAAFLQLAGPWMFDGMAETMRSGMHWDRAALDSFEPGRIGLQITLRLAPPVLLLGFLVIAFTIITQLGPAGNGRFQFGNLAPKGKRINPMSGLARMFGPNGWIEVGKGTLKVVLLGTIAYYWASSRIDQMLQLSAVGLSSQLHFAWGALTSLFYQLAGGLVVIALFDFPVQWIRRMRRLRMTLQEVKDENKEQEGNPEARNHRRQRQRQIAMGAIAGAMKKAQFVVTNPTHFAVALAWDPQIAMAPVVLAKGRGEKALAIRELAAEYELPCLSFPGLARALYYTTRERQMIREELYGAVAGVLAFVMALKRGEPRPAPVFNIPVELRFDGDGRPDPDDRYRPEIPAGNA
jgi:flagellar biosynthetic protein FlhB